MEDFQRPLDEYLPVFMDIFTLICQTPQTGGILLPQVEHCYTKSTWGILGSVPDKFYFT